MKQLCDLLSVLSFILRLFLVYNSSDTKFLGEISPLSILHHDSAQTNNSISKDELNKIINNKEDTDEKANSLPMEVDSCETPSNKRKRIASNSDSGPALKATLPSASESHEDLINGNCSNADIKKLLMSKLSTPYRELVESSKLDVDGMESYI